MNKLIQIPANRLYMCITANAASDKRFSDKLDVMVGETRSQLIFTFPPIDFTTVFYSLKVSNGHSTTGPIQVRTHSEEIFVDRRGQNRYIAKVGAGYYPFDESLVVDVVKKLATAEGRDHKFVNRYIELITTLSTEYRKYKMLVLGCLALVDDVDDPHVDLRHSYFPVLSVSKLVAQEQSSVIVL